MKRKMRVLQWTALGLALTMGAGTALAERIMLINGAGATFPYPIYSKWFAEFAKINTTVNFNYQSIGSGGGVRQIIAKTVDFGATDGPMNTDELAQANAAGGEILHVPTVLGGVVAVYNIPGINAKLKFTQKAIAGVFLGKLSRWNDPAIAGVNPGVALPDKPIIVVHRSDGSGTTYIWVDFLSHVSNEWKNRVGTNKSVNWPVGLGGKGNEGVAGLVKQMPYSIGYVELGYASHNHLTFGLLENAEGEFVDCTAHTVSEAAAGSVANMPADFRVSLVNAPGKETYPASSFTWLLVYRKQTNPVKGKALLEFLDWMLSDGQAHAEPLGYAPLPSEVIARIRQAIGKIEVADG